MKTATAAGHLDLIGGARRLAPQGRETWPAGSGRGGARPHPGRCRPLAARDVLFAVGLRGSEGAGADRAPVARGWGPM